jgi:hypothetical protein
LNRESKSYWLFVIGYWGRKRRSGFFNGERQRLAGCVTHLAGRLFNHGRATRPRGADTFGKTLNREWEE